MTTPAILLGPTIAPFPLHMEFLDLGWKGARYRGDVIAMG